MCAFQGFRKCSNIHLPDSGEAKKDQNHLKGKCGETFFSLWRQKYWCDNLCGPHKFCSVITSTQSQLYDLLATFVFWSLEAQSRYRKSRAQWRSLDTELLVRRWKKLPRAIHHRLSLLLSMSGAECVFTWVPFLTNNLKQLFESEAKSELKAW